VTREIHLNHTTRTADLKRMLNDRRREVRNDIRGRVRGRRSDGSSDAREEFERAEAGTQTVARIDDALVRLDAGKYGSCLECAREISERRLRALPFAVRCQVCEERREQELGRRRAIEQRSRTLSHSLDVLSP
jgi:RNA polymerase-binding transcription factor DksA